MQKTVDVQPSLVSIDSPLCLPAGRISVTDDDPGREKYGIIRECERELKRRGINVYPCLIQSMQSMTARGIRLASTLRCQGIPVIECYPGAAQDIMRVPRKGAGTQWLTQGLSEFGITSNSGLRGLNHDELDAITAALVGTFHLAGMSEALGTKDEAPLIIPIMNKENTPFVIGVSGPICAGKTTVARKLEKNGFAYTRFSQVIDDILSSKNIEATRLTRQQLGEEINVSGKQRWLCTQTVERVSGAKRIVVDGLRFPDDYAFLVESFGLRFFHLHVSASKNIRNARYETKGGDGQLHRVSEALVERQVNNLSKLAHRVFLNEGSRERLERYVDEFLTDKISEFEG